MKMGIYYRTPPQLQGQISVGIRDIKTVYQFSTKYEFPAVGDSQYLYIAIDENAAYRWDDDKLLYYCVGRDYLEIDVINGGDSNG